MLSENASDVRIACEAGLLSTVRAYFSKSPAENSGKTRSQIPAADPAEDVA